MMTPDFSIMSTKNELKLEEASMIRKILRFLIFVSLFTSIFATTLIAQPSNRNIVGYYTSWSIYARDYHIPDIPGDMITHINYAFANIENGQITLGDFYADVDRFYPGDTWDPGALRGCFRRFQVLKEEFPHVKTLISVGGWVTIARAI